MTTKLCTIKDCGNKYTAKGYCMKHYLRWRKHGDPHVLDKRRLNAQNYTDPSGYVRVPRHTRRETGCIFEHQLVMTQVLGRPLLPGETVHHKNGVKNDNRPENLELWVTFQPAGQRPEDLVAYAHEILERYKSPKSSLKGNCPVVNVKG